MSDRPFSITKTRQPFGNPRDWDEEPKRPAPDEIGEALGYPFDYYGTGEMIAGIYKSTNPRIRWQFQRIYYFKPIPVLVDLYNPLMPEPPIGEWADDERLAAAQERYIVRRREESILKAAAVQAYNLEHPDSKYGYWAIWERTINLNVLSAQEARAGGVVPLPEVIWEIQATSSETTSTK